jgi:glucose/arabinose dehydrogenase
MSARAVLATLLALAAHTADARAQARGTGLTLELVASGLQSPVHLVAPPGDPRLFIVEQPGRIRIVEGGALLETPFLDITDRVRAGGERGLLSVAFHPRYAENGFFYVNYTDRDGDTKVERYRVGWEPNRANPTSAKPVLAVDQPYANHNGGHILFGPDGMLYIGMGDGGSGGDPHGNGQDLRTLLGKLLRIDVDHGTPYGIPPDNPFVGRRGARPEIWALGLRNPWRMAFDDSTGLLYIADVGQNQWEEVHVEKADAAGLNYGWNVMEGDHCFRGSRCDRRGLAIPPYEYGHGEGCSITGGVVYRGRRIPWAAGFYFFADYCSGWIWSFRYAKGEATEVQQWTLPATPSPTSFGTDAAGEIYVVSHGGRVWRIAPAPASAPDGQRRKR